MNRGRQYNVAREKYRRINEAKAEKRAIDPFHYCKVPAVGERFDKLTASRPDAVVDGKLRWFFRCDCGVEFSMCVANARSNAKRGWCSCRDCLHEAIDRGLLPDPKQRSVQP